MSGRPNPYVGPRAFQTGERLFGRDYEIHELLNLFVAQRIVLLHAPSGAGKSSLVNAGLIPRLHQDGFEVLPVVRVNLAPPEPAPSEVFNRYVYSVLVSLEERLPFERRRAETDLACLTIAGYLREEEAAGRILSETDENPSPNLALIVDQFEEILTIEPNDIEGKMAFFIQMSEVLRDRSVWALFSMREDYLAALTPYLRPVPTHLANTYRLDFLDSTAAIQAVREPALLAGVAFEESAALVLVDNLRRVQVQQPDGTVRTELGQAVEPLQLQVICYRLWENLAADDLSIEVEDIEKLGDVNRSLSEYYDQQVAEAAHASGVSERVIRAWVADHLVTPTGIRGQVLMEPERSKGLENAVVRRLVNAYLLRAEKRGGATWFELAHDRLIQPVRESNQAWFTEHLSLLQKQAALWDSQERLAGLLIAGKELEQIRRWAAEHSDEMSLIDAQFLEACEQAALQAEQERRLVETTRKAEEEARAARRLRAFVALLVIGLLISVTLGIFAVRQTREAQTQSAIAGTALWDASSQRSTITVALGQANVEKENAVSALATATAALERAEQEKALADVKRNEVAVQATQSRILAATQQSAYLQSQATMQAMQVSISTTSVGSPDKLAVLESERLAQVSQDTGRQPVLSLLLALHANTRASTQSSRLALLSSVSRALILQKQNAGLLIDNGGPVRSLAFSPAEGDPRDTENYRSAGSKLAAASGENLFAWNLTMYLSAYTAKRPGPEIETYFAFPPGALQQVFFDPGGRMAVLLKTEPGMSLPTKVDEQIEGIDVFRGTGTVDWKQVAQGAGFAYAKATDGTRNLDSSFAENWFAMKEAGILSGAYHIFDFDHDPLDQALAFLDAVPYQPGDLPPVLDLSETARVVSFIHTEEIVNRVMTWLNVVEEETGMTPLLMIQPTNPAFAVYLNDPAFQRYPLWVMLFSRPEPERLFNGRRWLFWYYRDDFTIPGAAGKVGLSRFNGPRADLFALSYRGMVESVKSGEVLYPIQTAFDQSAAGGSTLVLRRFDGTLNIVDLRTYQELVQPQPLSFLEGGNILITSPGGQSVAVTSGDGVALVSLSGWQVDPLSEQPATAVAFSPDGEFAALAADDRRITVVPLSTMYRSAQVQQQVQTSVEPVQTTPLPARVNAMAFSADGFVLAAGLENGRVALVDPKRGTLIAVFTLPVDLPVTTLVFHPAEFVLAVGIDKGTVLVDLREQALASLGCQLAERELTVDERLLYQISEKQSYVCR